MKLKNLKPCPVDFKEEDHTYTLKSNGKLVPGCTSITENLNKPFLVPWAAKEAIGAAIERIGEIGKALMDNPSPEKAIEILMDCKSSWRKKSKEAADSGTIAHDYLEKYVKAKIAGTGKPKITEIKDPKAKQSVREFLKWEKQVKPHWLASELVVGSSVHEFGGKLDAVASIDGVPTLIDFKTSNQISHDYFLQTAGYCIALEEMGVNVWERMILRLPKTGDGFEVKIVPTPLDLDKATFLGLRQAQRFLSYVNNQNNPK